MDSEEKEDAEASFTLHLPPEPKKRKLDISKCIICQRCKGNEPLRTPKESSIEKLITSAKQRGDGVLCGLANGAEIVWHLPCYASYTSARNIRSAVNSLQSQISDIESDCSKENEGCRLS